MSDPFPTLAARRLAVLATILQKGPLTLPQLAAALNSTRHAVERALNSPWFERLSTGRNSQYGLSAAGKAEAAGLGPP